MEYEIHRSEVPSSLAGILHCFAALSCLFLCLRCLSLISGSGGAPTWFGENTQYEIHTSEVPRSFAGILHCVFCCLELPFLEQWFGKGSNLIAIRLTRWNPGVWGIWRGSVVPEGLQLDLKKTRNMKSTPLRYQGLLLVFCIVFCCLAAFFSPGAFLEQWFRKGSNLIAIRLTRWNPGVWGIWRGSVVPEGFQLGLRKTCNMKSTPLRYQGLLLVFWIVFCCLELPFSPPGHFWNSGSGRVPTWLQHGLQDEILGSDVFVVDRWFRRGSTLIWRKHAIWNPQVWGTKDWCLFKACNMKSTQPQCLFFDFCQRDWSTCRLCVATPFSLRYI